MNALTKCHTGEQKIALQREKMERQDQHNKEQAALLRQGMELRLEESKARTMQLQLELTKIELEKERMKNNRQ